MIWSWPALHFDVWHDGIHAKLWHRKQVTSRLIRMRRVDGWYPSTVRAELRSASFEPRAGPARLFLIEWYAHFPTFNFLKIGINVREKKIVHKIRWVGKKIQNHPPKVETLARVGCQACISLALRAPWRDATCKRLSEAFCPNIQPRAQARLTGLTSGSGITATNQMKWARAETGVHLTRCLRTLRARLQSSGHLWWPRAARAKGSG